MFKPIKNLVTWMFGEKPTKFYRFNGLVVHFIIDDSLGDNELYAVSQKIKGEVNQVDFFVTVDTLLEIDQFDVGASEWPMENKWPHYKCNTDIFNMIIERFENIRTEESKG